MMTTMMIAMMTAMMIATCMVDDVDDILIVGREPCSGVHDDLVVVRREQAVELSVVQRALGLVVNKRPENIATGLERLSVVCGWRVALLGAAHGRPAAVHVLADSELARRHVPYHLLPVDTRRRVGVGEPDAVAFQKGCVGGFGCVYGIDVDHYGERMRRDGKQKKQEQRDGGAEHAECNPRVHVELGEHAAVAVQGPLLLALGSPGWPCSLGNAASRKVRGPS
jgi:hypothetical protein